MEGDHGVRGLLIFYSSDVPRGLGKMIAASPTNESSFSNTALEPRASWGGEVG